MRKSVWVAVSIAVVIALAGCSASNASKPQPAPSSTAVLGTAGDTSQTAPTAEATKVVTPSPAAVEGMPSGLGVQIAPADGKTAISQVKAMQIAAKYKPEGATSVVARHVMFAKSSDKKPVDAWMITYHDATLPGAGGTSSSGKTGSITLFIDSSSGAVIDQLAYEPEAQ